MNSNSPKDFIANYELNDYRYSEFWSGREYEHKAEVTLLEGLFEKFLPDFPQRTIVDLGGAYGRLIPLYALRAKHIVLADYSTHELLEGKGKLLQTTYSEKVSFVALNAYQLPFSPNSVDALLSVRVMHHLKDIKLFWAELYRVLSPGGVAVIEFANKNHILAVLRHLLRFDLFRYLKQSILHVTHNTGSAQGMKEGQISIMYNFSPAYIKQLSQENDFTIEGTFACSFLRSTFLKKIFSLEKLIRIEKFLQKKIPHLLITPSVFIVLRKKGTFVEKENALLNALVCPICHKELKNVADSLICKEKHLFPQFKIGIFDLRNPRPESIDF